MSLPEYDLHNQRRCEIQQFALNAGSSLHLKPAEKLAKAWCVSQAASIREVVGAN